MKNNKNELITLEELKSTFEIADSVETFECNSMEKGEKFTDIVIDTRRNSLMTIENISLCIPNCAYDFYTNGINYISAKTSTGLTYEIDAVARLSKKDTNKIIDELYNEYTKSFSIIEKISDNAYKTSNSEVTTYVQNYFTGKTPLYYI